MADTTTITIAFIIFSLFLFAIGVAAYDIFNPSKKKKLLKYLPWIIFIFVASFLAFMTNPTLPYTVPVTPTADTGVWNIISTWIKSSLNTALVETDKGVDKTFGFLKTQINKITGWFPDTEFKHIFTSEYWKNIAWKRALFGLGMFIWCIIFAILAIIFDKINLADNIWMSFKVSLVFTIIYTIGSGIPIMSFILNVITFKIVGISFWDNVLRTFILASIIVFGPIYIERYRAYKERMKNYKEELEKQYIEKKQKL